MRVSMIVAIADNGVIGASGTMPWHIKEDLTHFKKVTMGKPIIVGRKTYESFPTRPLPGRTNLIVTRDATYVADGAETYRSVECAMARAGDLGDEVMIVGGGEIYRQAIGYTDRMYLTEVHASPDGDASFDFDRSEWIEVERQDFDGYSMVVMDKIRPSGQIR